MKKGRSALKDSDIFTVSDNELNWFGTDQSVTSDVLAIFSIYCFFETGYLSNVIFVARLIKKKRKKKKNQAHVVVFFKYIYLKVHMSKYVTNKVLFSLHWECYSYLQDEKHTNMWRTLAKYLKECMCFFPPTHMLCCIWVVMGLFTFVRLPMSHLAFTLSYPCSGLLILINIMLLYTIISKSSVKLCLPQLLCFLS